MRLYTVEQTIGIVGSSMKGEVEAVCQSPTTISRMTRPTLIVVGTATSPYLLSYFFRYSMNLRLDVHRDKYS